jgi:hypothetical protein
MCAFQILASTIAILAGFSCFCLVLPDTCWDRTWIMSLLFPSKASAVHHLQVTVPFDTTECAVPNEVIKWTINKHQWKLCNTEGVSRLLILVFTILRVIVAGCGLLVQSDCCWLWTSGPMVWSTQPVVWPCEPLFSCLSLPLVRHCVELCYVVPGSWNCPHLQ